MTIEPISDEALANWKIAREEGHTYHSGTFTIALIARLEKAERERDEMQKIIQSTFDKNRELNAERDALRARVAELERRIRDVLDPYTGL